MVSRHREGQGGVTAVERRLEQKTPCASRQSKVHLEGLAHSAYSCCKGPAAVYIAGLVAQNASRCVTLAMNAEH